MKLKNKNKKKSKTMSTLADVAQGWRKSRKSQRREYARVFDALSAMIREKSEEQHGATSDADLSPTFYLAAVLNGLKEIVTTQTMNNDNSNNDDDDDDENLDQIVDDVDRKNSKQTRSKSATSLMHALLVWLGEILPRLAAGVIFSTYGELSDVLLLLINDRVAYDANVRSLAFSCVVALLCHAALNSQLKHADSWRALKPAALGLLRATLLHALSPADSTTQAAALLTLRAIHASPPHALATALSGATRRACERAVLGVDTGANDGAGVDANDEERIAASLAELETAVDLQANALRVLQLIGADLRAGEPSLLASLAPADVPKIIALILPCLTVPALRKTALNAVVRVAATSGALPDDEAIKLLNALLALHHLPADLLAHNASAIAAVCESLGASLGAPALVGVVERLLPLLRHSDATVGRSTADALERALTVGLQHVGSLDADSETLESLVFELDPLCAAVRECLRTPYRSAWALVLRVLTSMATCLGAASEPLLGETLQIVAELYAASESGAELQSAMRGFVAAMLRSMGPSKLLQLLPLQFDVEEMGTMQSRAREWLIPILRDNAAQARAVSLDLFSGELAVLADALSERVQTLQATESPIDAVFARLLQQRCAALYALLPVLCSAQPKHTDVAESFQRTAPRLAQALESDPTLRAVAARSIAALIETNFAVLRTLNERDSEMPFDASCDLSDANVVAARANLETIAAMAPKFLPRLVNAVAQYYDPSMGKMASAVATTDALARAITSYARIADPAFAALFAGRVFDRLADASAAAEAVARGADVSTLAGEQATLSDGDRRAQRFFLTAVAASLAPALAAEQATRLVMLLAPQMTQNNDRRLQKVSFRALDALCRESDSAFFEANWNGVISPLLVGSMAHAVPAAKRLRLQCISSALERRVAVLRNAADQLQAAGGEGGAKQPNKKLRRRATAVSTLVIELLPSVILCTGEHNARTRATAMKLIDDLSNAMRCAGDDCGADATAAGVRATTFLEHVAAGLAGASSLMIAATTRVLGRVMRNYRALLSDDVVGRYCDLIFQLLDGEDKQSVRSAVIFARAALSVNRGVVFERLPFLVAALSRWLANPHHHFRGRLRRLLERLVDRFGADALSPHITNPTARRALAGVRQRANRRERLRKGELDAGDGADDDDDDAGETRRARKRREGENGDVLIKDNDEPLDFLDHSSLHKVVSAESRKRGARGGDDDDDDEPMKETADGRLVVPDDASDDDDSDDVNDSDSDSGSADGDSGSGGGALGAWANKQWVANEKKGGDKKSNKRVASGDRNAKRSTVGEVGSRRGVSSSKTPAGDADADDEEKKNDSVRSRRRTRRIEARRRAVRAQLAERDGTAKREAKQQRRRPGAEFRARNARGDLQQKAGDLQPYAYVPLDPAALNQRRRKEATADLVAATEKARSKRSRKR
jgi:hypothetical protein